MADVSTNIFILVIFYNQILTQTKPVKPKALRTADRAHLDQTLYAANSAVIVR